VESVANGVPVSRLCRVGDKSGGRFREESTKLAFTSRRIFPIEFGQALGLILSQRTFNDLPDQVTAELELGGRYPKELEQSPCFQKLLPRKEQ
jgi:hypothetical protein